jgi:peptidyl-prolyl cis-trans isomerase SurA
MRIIYLKSNTPPHQANLRDDYQKLAAAALNEKRRKAYHTWFEKNKNTVFIDIDPEYNKCDILGGSPY